MRTFEYRDARSHKFWHIEVEGTRCTVTHGKVGSSEQRQTRDFHSTEKVQAAADKFIAQLLGKGYRETTPSKPAGNLREAPESAIVENPRDKAAYPALADYLQEQGSGSSEAENRRPVLGGIMGAFLGVIASEVLAIGLFLLFVAAFYDHKHDPSGLYLGIIFVAGLVTAVLCLLGGAVGGAVGGATSSLPRPRLRLSRATWRRCGLVFLILLGFFLYASSRRTPSEMRWSLAGAFLLAIFLQIGGAIGLATRKLLSQCIPFRKGAAIGGAILGAIGSGALLVALLPTGLFTIIEAVALVYVTSLRAADVKYIVAALCCLSGTVGGAVGGTTGRPTRASIQLLGVITGTIFLGVWFFVQGEGFVLFLGLLAMVLATLSPLVISGVIGVAIGVATRNVLNS
jgi:predicted DNA-binding WGR domain protein